MKIIDLSLPLETGMWVYPGDPEVVIEPVQFFESDEWNMRRIEMCTHDGTHVNVPIHSAATGKNLDDYQLSDFMGPARIYKTDDDINPKEGIIFTQTNIDDRLTELLITKKPKFIGLSSNFEFDIECERRLLAAGLISFERLANTESLPDTFYFHGAPLKIVAGDGSPVRAYAVVV